MLHSHVIMMTNYFSTICVVFIFTIHLLYSLCLKQNYKILTQKFKVTILKTVTTKRFLSLIWRFSDRLPNGGKCEDFDGKLDQTRYNVLFIK